MMSSVKEDKEVKSYPELIYIISGKRKSGKDYIANKLRYRFGEETAVIIHLSGPLKFKYAEERNLDADRLMDSSLYKENFREHMIKWGEEQRQKDPYVFCNAALVMTESHRFPIWIVSDARRESDLQYFNEKYMGRVVTIRVTATVETRKKRGWIFKAGVDDKESECGLDSISNWDFIIENNDNSEETVAEILEQILKLGKKFLSSTN